MTLTRLDKAPFPWFGGKSDACDLIWQALGDVAHYVEPFFGSGVVLLRRPHTANRSYYSETVNDLDGLLCNAWRALQFDPQATAEAASWPVCEADLHARHLAIVRWAAEPLRMEWLMGDPAHYDATIAGWWIWGVSCWIGSGFASGEGPWIAGDDGVMRRREDATPGVSRQIPHLGDDGQGVNRPQSREPGVAGSATEGPEDWQQAATDDYAASYGYHPLTMPEVRRWFAWLSARMRHVRILNGTWSRAVTPSVVKTLPVRQRKGSAGVFLDPPYGADADRDDRLYVHDSLTVAADVRTWCLENGADPSLRIVLAGFAGEGHEALEEHGWRSIPWFRAGWLKGGMAQQNANGHQQHRERLWLSPHCLRTSAEGETWLPMDELWSEAAP